MKNTLKIFIVSILTFSLNSCVFNHGESGNGNLTTDKRKIDPEITEIYVSNSIDVVLTQGNNCNLEVTADSNLLEYIVTEEDGNAIYIKIKDNSNLQNIDELKVKVTLPNITYISTSGASSLKTTNTIISKEIELKASSSSDLVISLESENLTADASSAAEIKIKGKAINVKYESSSSATINAEKLFANYIDAKASSAGNISCSPIINLDAKASSGGTVHFENKPKTVNKNESSGGKVYQY
jgi:hypothetical protein